MELLYKKIEAYLRGTLNPSEKQAFEKQIATNADLANEVRLHRLMEEELGDVEKVALRTQLEKIGAAIDLSNLTLEEEMEMPFVVENLDDFLQNIIKEALKERTPPNPRLERKRLALVKSSVSIEVIQPQSDVLCGEEIYFELGKGSKQPIRLVLQNAKGKSVGIFQIPVEEKTYLVSLADVDLFPSGVYYWTLILEGVPVVGRFYVCREEDLEGVVNG